MSNSPLVTYSRISPNRTSPRNHKIDTITIHCIVGQWTAKQGCDYFATTGRECSANYVVGKDGSIGLSVEEKDRSWCSSSRSNDHRAITIEVASDGPGPGRPDRPSGGYLPPERDQGPSVEGRQVPDRPGGQAEHDRSPVVREQGLSW